MSSTVMTMKDLSESNLIKPGDYTAVVTKVELKPSKSKPGQDNINLTLDVILDSGRTVKVWDMLPSLSAKVAWRYAQYIQAMRITIDPTLSISTSTFFDLLTKNIDDATMFNVRVDIENSPGYAPKNRVVNLKPLSENTSVAAIIKQQRHDTDTDAPAQPSKFSSTGEQSAPSEDRQIA